MDSAGSRSRIEDVLKDLDGALDDVSEVNDNYTDSLKDDDNEKDLSEQYILDIEEAHQKICERIKNHLEARKGEAPSEAGASKAVSKNQSAVSVRSNQSAASKEAEIGACLKQLELRQLEKRVEEERRKDELERQQRETERQARIARARDAAELAAREAELRKAAENDLQWDRRHDFDGEAVTLDVPTQAERPNETLTEVRPPEHNCRTVHHPEGQTGQGSIPGPKQVQTATSWILEAASRPRQVEPTSDRLSGGHRSVPQIHLPKFNGKAAEWPQWIGLFKTLIHDQPALSDAEKLAHLQSSVTGLAKQTIEGMLLDGALYPTALETLMKRFGREEDIVNASLSAVFSSPPMKSMDPVALEKLQAVVHCAVTVLDAMGFHGDLNSTENLRRIIMKLPNDLKREWGREVVKIEPERPNLKYLDSWLGLQVRIAMAVPVQPPERVITRTHSDSRRAPRAHSTSVAMTMSPEPDNGGGIALQQQNRPAEPPCSCGEQHDLTACPAFLQKTPNDRAKFVGESGRCFSCLGHDHRSRQCRVSRKCGENGCQGRHHHLLHGSERIFPRAVGAGGRSNRTVAAASELRGTTLLQIVPVRVHGDSSYVDTFAALDSGAQTSLCTENLAKKLKLTGKSESLRLNNVEGGGPQRIAMRTALKLTPLARESSRTPVVADEVWTVPKLNIPVPQISRSARAKWHHVKNLDISLPRPEQVEVLLGANVLEGILQHEVRIGDAGQPVAIKTHFGWTLTGTITSLVPASEHHVMHISRSVTDEDELGILVQKWWNTDLFGTTHAEKKPMSNEDRRAVQILERTAELVDGHVEAPLLWKDDEVSLPENRLGALRRLERTEKSLLKNPEKAKKYQDAIESYVTLGHARKLQDSEVSQPSSKRWYLPHHAVYNPNKPEKIRVVFDAAAKFDGTSLNDNLLTGPDLLQDLPGLLIRFRERLVAIAGDIDQMFHQVQIVPRDRPALSFLWRNMEQNRPPDTYEMNKAIFGAKCSPAIASFALQIVIKNCSDITLSREEAAEVSRQFYMDDFVTSKESVETAKTLLRAVTEVVAEGGFKLRKWTSNSREVLESVKPEDRAHPTADISMPLPSERVLGLAWDPEQDEIGVNRPERRNASTTKRGVLAAIASTFDPLGLVAPFTLQAKLLMQDLWKQQLSWDSELSEDDVDRWVSWQAESEQLSQLRIPRCYSASEAEIVRRELHIFSDASEAAFGAVGYLRQIDSAGGISCALVMSRTRVAPLKKLTIVRLELQGAVLATRLRESIESALSTSVDQTFYWTDSEVVLGYINSETRRFQTFVANRVAEIRDRSEPCQWRHVPGVLNPADDCSRGRPVSELASDSRWFKGPAFLYRLEDEWPAAPVTYSPGEDDPEVKTVCSVTTGQSTPALFVDPARYSSWSRYRRVTAWVFRFALNFVANHSAQYRDWACSGPLSTEELRLAEDHIVKGAQQEAFKSDIDLLSRGKAVSGGSSLLQLTPLLDSNGVMRVGGRLEKSSLPSSVKHPVILPRHHDVTRLVVTSVHRRVLHSGVDHTLNELRQAYWVPKARSTVKSYLQRCSVCQKRRSHPEPPLMADLPEARFDCQRAFSSVGLDFFGPLHVRVGRRTERRYVLLVTCLASRALHLEVTSSLDTDSFILALRRFIARRGKPSQIFCDNWKSFKRADKELREALRSWNVAHISDTLTQEGIKWRFNPPGGPHMGGCWERLVSSVKRALRVVLGNQLVTDEVLSTVLTEVEFMLNSRPLTYVSNDAGDQEALTPNHLLLGRDSPSLPPGVFSGEQLSLRRRWRRAQQLAEHFWKRWHKEYLPTLIKRGKWSREGRRIQVGDVVLVAENNTPRGRWPLARVVKVFPGSDGRVRTVKLKTKNGTYVRPVVKLCVLEGSDQ